MVTDHPHAPIPNRFPQVYLAVGVIVAGAIGAVLAFSSGLSSVVLAVPYAEKGPIIQLPLHAALGGFAAMIFVFLIANTDRSDIVRLFVLAGISGFVWDTVIQAGKAFVSDRQLQVATVEKVTAQAEDVTSSIVTSGDQSPPLDFSNFLKSYSEAVGTVDRPDLWRDLMEDPNILGAFEEARKKPWYQENLPEWSNQYPELNLESLFVMPNLPSG